MDDATAGERLKVLRGEIAQLTARAADVADVRISEEGVIPVFRIPEPSTPIPGGGDTATISGTEPVRAMVWSVRSSRLALTWGDASVLAACPQVKRAVPTVLWVGLAGIGGGGPGLPLPARVGFEGGSAEGLEPGEQVVQPPVVVDPGLVV